ncbi:maltose permease Mal61p [Trichomonascus vanleenenianus]|uniref:maltose permease Mal61p n=1 Tax=Trichomonascus vanleenenianus TaxID=2268995 RepID=UPI003ECB9E73
MDKTEVEHNEAAQGDYEPDTKLESTQLDAQLEAEYEKSMGLWEGLRTYPKAVLWCIIVSFTVIMDGYDTALLGSFYAYSQFKEKYGDLYGDQYEVPAKWQTALSMTGSASGIIGIMICGQFVDRIGHRKIMMGLLVYMAGIVFMYVFCPNRTVLLIAGLLFGIATGIFSVLAPTYASEVCPVVLRGYLTTFINGCWVIGQLVAQAVLRGNMNRTDDWAYRLPFALQWMWLPFLFVGIYFAPDSPWWLVRKGRIEDAVKSVKRLASSKVHVDPHRAVAMMIHTNELEKDAESGTSYLDCFKGTDLRRTEITAVAFVIQAVAMGNVMAYSTFFFESAGLDETNSFNLGIGQYALGLIGVLTSWFLIANTGRRTIYIGGVFSMMILFFIMGCVSLAPSTNQAAPWVIAVLVLIIVLIYDATLGPVTYSVISEMSSTRLRGKTIALARNLFNLWAIVNAVIYPYIMNTTAGDWKGKVGFFQAGLCLVCVTWAFFRLPEPKGRTYEELDIMFLREIPARKFSSYKVEPLASTKGGEEEKELEA